MLQRLGIALSLILVSFGPLDISLLKRALGFRQVRVHTCAPGNDVPTETIAGASLLLLQMIEAGVHGRGSAGKLIYFMFDLIQLGGRVRGAVWGSGLGITGLGGVISLTQCRRDCRPGAVFPGSDFLRRGRGRLAGCRTGLRRI
jgi:hypothetical protein